MDIRGNSIFVKPEGLESELGSNFFLALMRLILYYTITKIKLDDRDVGMSSSETLVSFRDNRDGRTGRLTSDCVLSSS